MTLTSKTLAVLIIPILFGGIFFSSVMGWWQTESTKEAAVFTSGEFAGQANPADIRGSYTFGDVEKNFGIPAVKLAEAFNVENNDPSAFQVKSLEEMYAASPEEIGTSSVRLFVALYLGLPFDLSTEIYLPAPAADMLWERSLPGEQAVYVETHTVSYQEANPIAEAVEPATQADPELTDSAHPPAEETATDSSERLVKGKTTFAELLTWGVPKEAIEKLVGAPMPDSPGIKVKDFCTENGLTFETIKTALQAEVDRVK